MPPHRGILALSFSVDVRLLSVSSNGSDWVPPQSAESSIGSDRNHFITRIVTAIEVVSAFDSLCSEDWLVEEAAECDSGSQSLGSSVGRWPCAWGRWRRARVRRGVAARDAAPTCRARHRHGGLGQASMSMAAVTIRPSFRRCNTTSWPWSWTVYAILQPVFRSMG